MDSERLAAQAIGLVASYFKRAATRVEDHVSDAIARRVVDLIDERLGNDEFGRVSLTRLRERPDDRRSRQAVEGALLDALRDDPAFASAIEKDVAEADSGSVDQSVADQINVAAIRKVRGPFSMGPMNYVRTRQTRIVFGGGVAVLAIIAALVITQRQDGETPNMESRPEQSDTSLPDKTQDPSRSAEAIGSESDESGPLLEEQFTLGEPIEWTSSDGYQYRLAAAWRGTDPSAMPNVSAPPGMTFVHLVLRLTNLQPDRTAPLTDQVSWYLELPVDAIPDAEPDGCGEILPGFCRLPVACYVLDDYGTPQTQSGALGTDLIELSDYSLAMPAGESWWLGCVLSSQTRRLAHITMDDAIRDTLSEADIRLVKIDYEDPYYPDFPGNEVIAFEEVPFTAR